MSARQAKKKADAKPLTLADEEWDFSSCPPTQLRWCDVYEHMRQDTAFIQDVHFLRSNGHWSAKALERFSSSEHAELAKAFFTHFREFPAKPFLLIDPASRALRCHKMDEHRKTAFFSNTTTTY